MQEVSFLLIFNKMMKEITMTIEGPAAFTERFINQTSQHLFLTGKAGTGKTTLLKKIVETTHKNTVIVAPTGIAALNAGGVTIHSFFQLPFGGFVPEFIAEPILVGNTKLETKETLKRHFQFNAVRQNLIKSLELLIIDEVSMLRADLLDAIDWTLRNVRKNNRPFGGVQVLFIGDLLQLPPVVKPEEWSVLQQHYHGVFFFNAKVLTESPPLYIELDKIFRQDDATFIDILNNLRNNQVSEKDQRILNEYVNPLFDPTKEEGYITLTTHNAKADDLNATALNALKGKIHFYEAEIVGDFPKHMFPLDPTLALKVGAQIMFVKNDVSFEKNFYNGKMGRIQSLSEDEIVVLFPEEKRTITVEKYEWTNIKYQLDQQTGEIKEEILGTFVHFPIKLAWAITVHKSQGLTFEKAVLDVSQVFAPGQAYVALSRLRSLQGLVLLKPISMNGLINDQSVVAYGEQKADSKKLTLFLDKETARFVYQSLMEAFDWYDYTAKWATFELGLKLQGPKTEKGKDKAWAANQMQLVQTTFDAAKKFQAQLNTIFSKETINWEFVSDRVQAAYTYFFKLLDTQVYAVLKRKIELTKIKRTKDYQDEIEELLNLLITVVLRLKKVRLLVEAVCNGSEINKETVKTAEITNYVIAKIAVIQQELRQNGNLLSDEDDSFDAVIESAKKHYSQRDKKEKQVSEKKSTHEKTLELLEDGLDINEIARLRQLSATTINGHFVQLIRAEKITIEQVLPEERIRELALLFDSYEGESLAAIKEKLGDKATWNELKLIQATKLL